MEDRIREKAYYLWEEAGKPEGRSEWFWSQAQYKLIVELSSKITRERYGKNYENLLINLEIEEDYRYVYQHQDVNITSVPAIENWDWLKQVADETSEIPIRT